MYNIALEAIEADTGNIIARSDKNYPALGYPYNKVVNKWIEAAHRRCREGHSMSLIITYRQYTEQQPPLIDFK